MDNILGLIFSESFLFSVFRLTTPILLATLSSVISERAGVGNITMEGTMLISAFVGVVVSTWTGSAWIGFLVAVLIGGATGYLLSYIIFKMKVNDILAGLSINLLGSGGTVFLLYALTGVRGISSSLSSKVMPSVDIPIIKDIPVLGAVVSGQNIVTYMSFISAFVIWFLLFRTSLGLRIVWNGWSIYVHGLCILVCKKYYSWSRMDWNSSCSYEWSASDSWYAVCTVIWCG